MQELEIRAGWWRLRWRRNASKLEPVLVGGSSRLKAPRSRQSKMAEEAMRAMHQQFTTALEGLTRQNTELQNELNQGRQQAANELAALRQEVRGAPLRGTQATGVSVDAFAGEAKRFLRGARRVARLEHSVQGVRWRSDTTSAEVDG